ncbi:alpha/beta fold hydrolase [Corynebacterium comes]|uniref:Alpha/beta hydrolase family protein n=1 Tax=Corynebacterium comes TaxID=2675218 RepID=A0A6B8W8X6_9CORY|nr:alpha/beta hydrolase [Corynebacterium comes]QGU03458.1 Alpha/beta hydrolase family protein [Corynebacterium comes]
MTIRSIPILFIGGSGLPAWIWDDVRHHLGDRPGDRVAAHPASGVRASLNEYVDAAIESAPAGKFLIVAHSSGGVIAAEVARRVPERVEGLLAVSAVIPAPGRSFIRDVPIPNRWILSVTMRLMGTRPPASAIRRGLAHGLPEEITGRVIEEFVPESSRLYLDRTGTGPWEIKRGYLFTTADRELPLKLQQQSAQRLGATWTAELPTGHLPMIEDPQGMAGAVVRFLGE